MDALNRGMQEELAKIRARDAASTPPVRADAALGEVQWKMQNLMVTSGLIIGPIVAILVIILILWLWLA